MKSVQKAEMQAGEDIAIKERDDGSALAAMEDHVDPFEGTDDQHIIVKTTTVRMVTHKTYPKAVRLRVTPKKIERPFEPRVVKSDA
jgi:hypothetical protein